MKLSEWTKRAGVHHQGAWEWACDSKTPVLRFKTHSGSWVVLKPEQDASGRVVVCGRVSSDDQKPDLDQSRESEESTEDLVKDMADLLTLICARLHGRRAPKSRDGRALAAAAGDEPSA